MAVLGAKGQVAAEPLAQVVAVEHRRFDSAAVEFGIQGVGQGALARAAQPREPEHGAFLAHERFAVRDRNSEALAGDVG